MIVNTGGVPAYASLHRQALLLCEQLPGLHRALDPWLINQSFGINQSIDMNQSINQ